MLSALQHAISCRVALHPAPDVFQTPWFCQLMFDLAAHQARDWTRLYEERRDDCQIDAGPGPQGRRRPRAGVAVPLLQGGVPEAGRIWLLSVAGGPEPMAHHRHLLETLANNRPVISLFSRRVVALRDLPATPCRATAWVTSDRLNGGCHDNAMVQPCRLARTGGVHLLDLQDLKSKLI